MEQIHTKDIELSTGEEELDDLDTELQKVEEQAERDYDSSIGN